MFDSGIYTDEKVVKYIPYDDTPGWRRRKLSWLRNFAT